ncbi:hypothetical protein NHX12_029427 [Muraenolepis orangiensis]|uniref:Uncharacterized protein n=1 Tax=Muraenolepis orangiensis TaxID=630683 RepID=A0A9Q0EB52_9TELE|nr:hypothetical protein NHX12_029427 [Muraenolepis orangiensis]
MEEVSTAGMSALSLPTGTRVRSSRNRRNREWTPSPHRIRLSLLQGKDDQRELYIRDSNSQNMNIKSSLQMSQRYISARVLLQDVIYRSSQGTLITRRLIMLILSRQREERTYESETRQREETRKRTEQKRSMESERQTRRGQENNEVKGRQGEEIPKRREDRRTEARDSDSSRMIIEGRQILQSQKSK